MPAHAAEVKVALGAHCTAAYGIPLISMGSARPGVPLHCSVVPAESMCGLLESGQLARRGHIGFEAVWPHHITSCDGRMAAIMRTSASKVVGNTVDAVFSEASDRNAVCMAAAASCKHAHSVFTFRGLTDGCESQSNGVAVRDRRPSLVMVGAARCILHQRMFCLELIALPPPHDDFEQPRGEVTGHPSTADCPCRLCDSTLELRLGGAACLTDFALDASRSRSDSEITGYRVEGQALTDKLDKLDL